MQRTVQQPDAILLLADGTVFHGKSLGKKGTSGGELCFNTGMTGYQEIYTDPSYFGQIVIHTMPHIGNYGVKKEEVESSSVKISGMVCSGFSNVYSRLDGDDHLNHYLSENGIVGISGIDTRKLVRHIRDKGAMNAVISSELLNAAELQVELKKVPDMESLELATQVMTKTPWQMGPETGKRVAVLDFGVKLNIVREMALEELNCLVLPGNSSLEEILAFEPDAFFLSNGPGDPASMDAAVTVVKSLLATGKPLFGICLGHQLLARAFGLSTYKMKNGHRGLNHPVKNLLTGHCEITSQNHGFAVDPTALSNHPDLILSHINLNDQTVEGMQLKSGQGFSVQYHPEASPGPHDSRYLFRQFRELIG